MLKLINVNASYGNIHVLRDISIELPYKGIVSIIGNNGAGKSTILKCISGLIKDVSGNIIFKEEDITHLPASSIVSKGLIQVPEGRGIFFRLTVEENLLMGAYLQTDKSNINDDLEYVYNLFPRLKDRRKQMGGTLSGGEQQMLALGRSLMSRPKLLMLDEPSMGLAPKITTEIFDSIIGLHDKDISILLVEQNANLALKICDKAYVIETGEVVLQGSGAELLKDERVKKAYLGAG